MTKRTKHRSRSGAQTECPECKKRLRGRKGLKRHMIDEHGFKPDDADRRAADAALAHLRLKRAARASGKGVPNA